NEQSHLKIKAGPSTNEYNSELLVNPSKRYGQMNLRSNNLKHESVFKVEEPELGQQQQGKTASFKTNTMYRDSLLADVKAQLRGLRGENKIEAELPRFTLKSIIDVPAQQGSIDLRHRHS